MDAFTLDEFAPSWCCPFNVPEAVGYVLVDNCWWTIAFEKMTVCVIVLSHQAAVPDGAATMAGIFIT
jgi:hypothetical protein